MKFLGEDIPRQDGTKPHMVVVLNLSKWIYKIYKMSTEHNLAMSIQIITKNKLESLPECLE